MGNPWVWPPAGLTAPQPTGTSLGPRTTFNAALAGAGGIVDVPGPAAGSVRVFDTITAVSNTVALTLATVTCALNPGARLLGNLIAAFNTGNFAIGLVLEAGESVRVTNNGANAGRVTAIFYDVPKGSLSSVRLGLTLAPQIAVPAPAAGYNEIYLAGQDSGGVRQVRFRVVIFNPDTITHTLEFFLGGVLHARSQAIAANAIGALASAVPQVPAGAGNLTVGLAAAVAVTPPTFGLTYETFT